MISKPSLSKPIYSNRIERYWPTQKPLKPLFPVARFFGLFPYSKNWKISESWYDFSTKFLVIVLCLGLFQIVYAIFTPDEILIATVFNVVLHIARATTEMGCISAHLVSITRRTADMSALMRYLGHEVDPRVKMGCRVARYYTSVALNNWLLGNIVLNLYSIWTKTFEGRVLLLSISINNTLIGIIAFLFCSTLEVLTSELKHLHSRVDRSRNLKELIRQHQSLNALGEIAGRFYSFQMLLYCIRISVTVVQDIHLTIQQLLKPMTTETASFLVTVALQGAYDLYFLHLITAYSQSLQEESLKFYSALTTRVLRNKMFYTDIEITTYLAMKDISKQSAGGFFELNSSVFASVVGGCISYSVIVIQLSRTGE